MRFGAAAAIPAVVWLLTVAGPAGAVVYRWVDEDGVVNLSDDRSLYDAHRRQGGADRDGPLLAPPPGVVEPPDAPAPSDAAGRRRTEGSAAEMMRLAGLGQQCELLLRDDPGGPRPAELAFGAARPSIRSPESSAPIPSAGTCTAHWCGSSILR